MADILQVNWKYTVGNKTDKMEEEDKDYEPEEGSKYKLRAKKRKEMEERTGRKRGPKPKNPARMSKYRRKTANARERMRMGEINEAFENLKSKVPLPTVGIGKQKSDKLTKINILHVAINYINALENILETGESEVKIYPEKLIENPFVKPEPLSESSQICAITSPSTSYTSSIPSPTASTYSIPISETSQNAAISSPCPSMLSPPASSPTYSRTPVSSPSSYPPVSSPCLSAATAGSPSNSVTNGEGPENKFCHDSGSSSGEDSGIQEDSDIEFPDWTELSSTLDIRSSQGDGGPPGHQGARPHLFQCNFNPNAIRLRPYHSNDLDKSPMIGEITKKVANSKPVTLSSRIPVKTYGRKLSTRATDSNLINATFFGCDGGAANKLSNEVFCLFEEIDGMEDINFCYDDPFPSFLC